MKAKELTPRYPVLSFKELENWASLLKPKLEGARLERILIPETPAHPENYFKKEWVLELSNSIESFQLYLSLRAQASGVVLYPTRYFKNKSHASRSGFDLSLSKSLEGTRLTRLKMIPGERLLILEFKGTETFQLILNLIPASPFGVLLQVDQLLAASDTRESYHLPEPRVLTEEQLKKIPNRAELTSSIAHYQKIWEEARQQQALLLRRNRLESILKTELDSVIGKIRSLEEQLLKSQKEPDWNYFGSLFQTHFYSKPEPKNGFYELFDYEKNQTALLPADPKLTPKQQLERYFHAGKRNKKRLEETALRIQDLRTKQKRLEELKFKQDADLSLETLKAIEAKLGITDSGRLALKSKEQRKLAQFSGQQYRSKEGLTILVGRNLNENLELTFKIARGNDLWLHVKGRPGAHTVILLPPKKTASLETLLDAANLCIVNSGGREWGKTDVDYTLRKNVKKIKNQTEVSYTQNKTLSVTVESDRLKRLYENED